MHLKLFLLFMFVFGGLNLHAQYVPTTWGSGAAMGGNQMQCAHEYKTADMLVAGNKQVKADKKELSRLKKERRNLKRDVTKLKRDMARNKRTLNNNFKRNISNLIMDHLEEGRSPDSYKSCSATNNSCDPIGVDKETIERTELIENETSNSSTDQIQISREIRSQCYNNGKRKNDYDTCVEQVKSKIYRESSSNKFVERTVTDVQEYFSRQSQGSSGTSEDEAILSALRSLRSGGDNSSSGAGNYDTPSEMCIPYRGNTQSVLAELYQQDGSACLNLMKGFSNADGTLNPGICSADVSIYNSKRDVSECRKAIEDMNDLSSDLQAKLMDLESLDYAIEDAEDALRALQDDLFDELVADGKVLEGECAECDEPVYREKPSMWSNVSQLLGLGLGAAAAYYTADKVSDKNARLGWPTNPYLGVQVGFPFVMAGIYGGILGGQSHGGYGCANTVGGIGGGAFGYPPGMFGGPVSGGMYMPGMGPWGMPGPWSGWGQMGGGGFLGGLAAMGGMMGGYPGGMMMGGYPGGFPGGPFGGVAAAGGFAGGYPGGMMMGGYPGGFPGGYPGGVVGGMGVIGGLAGGGGYPGGFGAGGFPGMPMGGFIGNAGVAGGFAGGYPGGMYAGGGIPGMIAGGGGIPGMYGGGIPGMMAGAAGGLGLAGGNSAYLQMQMQMMEQQQRQMQIQMETQMRKAQQQQQAMQTISTLAQQIQQLQLQINTTYQGLFSDSYGGASFNSNTLVNGIQLNSNIPTRPGSHR